MRATIFLCAKHHKKLKHIPKTRCERVWHIVGYYPCIITTCDNAAYYKTYIELPEKVMK